jgi:putative transposase
MLETGKIYHLYNRGNNRENLFYKKENYHYFIRQFDKYLSNFTDVYAYCLLPNHFHFLIKIKEEAEILRLLPNLQNDEQHLVSLKDLPSVRAVDLPSLIINKFRLLFMSYAKAINKQENRVGSLFQKQFKIKAVNNDSYFSCLVFYIHANPQKHGLIDDFREWNYSSYHSIISERISKLKKKGVIDWFGNIEEYKEFHKNQFDFKNLESMELEY